MRRVVGGLDGEFRLQLGAEPSDDDPVRSVGNPKYPWDPSYDASCAFLLTWLVAQLQRAPNAKVVYESYQVRELLRRRAEAKLKPKPKRAPRKTPRPMPAKRRAALEAELKALRGDPHWRLPKLRNRIDKIRVMLAPVKRARRSRFEIEQQRHLGCRAYPNCDLDPLGCVYSAAYEDKC